MLGTAIFVVLVVSLHVVQRELDPVTRPISDYVFAPAGWMVRVALVAVGVGALGLTVAVRARLSPPRPRAAFALLVVFGGSMITAGVFPTLPLSADGEEYLPTVAGVLHVLAAGVGFTSLAVCAPVLGRRLFDPGRALSTATRIAGMAVPVGYLCFLASALVQPLLIDIATPIIGVGQRIMVAACMTWLALAAVLVRPRATSADDS